MFLTKRHLDHCTQHAPTQFFEIFCYQLSTSTASPRLTPPGDPIPYNPIPLIAPQCSIHLDDSHLKVTMDSICNSCLISAWAIGPGQSQKYSRFCSTSAMIFTDSPFCQNKQFNLSGKGKVEYFMLRKISKKVSMQWSRCLEDIYTKYIRLPIGTFLPFSLCCAQCGVGNLVDITRFII